VPTTAVQFLCNFRVLPVTIFAGSDIPLAYYCLNSFLNKLNLDVYRMSASIVTQEDVVLKVNELYSNGRFGVLVVEQGEFWSDYSVIRNYLIDVLSSTFSGLC